MRTDWIRIEDLSRFMIKGGIKQYHPDDPRHTPYWRKLKKMCIEGLWGEDFGGYRYMPGRLFFYGNFCTIEDTDEDDKVRHFLRPSIGDIEWERAYMYLEAEGFSGWTDDDEYTSEWAIQDYIKNYDVVKTKRNPRFHKEDGGFKTFIHPRDNIRKVHNQPLGSPLRYNNTQNIIELGSRGGGKSYWYALGGALYRMCFDAIKFYTDHWRMNPPTAKVLVGSGRTDKSSEFCSKIEIAMDYLAKLPELGAWGKVGDIDYQPSPFYKDMKGSLKPNNKDNAWRHEYSMQVGSQWIDGYGSKSCVYHVNYSPQKKDGAEAGAGGRYTDVIYEEVGLTELVIEAYNSNRATVATGATTFGVQVFLGTSGNMDTIEGAKKIFERPGDYETLGYTDVYDGTSDPIGFFLPCYMTARKFKDKNGNTDLEASVAFYEKRREAAAKSSDPSVLRVERMNYPMNPSDMWQTEKGHILPSAEAEVREKDLKRDDFYLSVGTPVKLMWDTKEKYGVGYEIAHEAEPFFHFPLDSNQQRKSLTGAIMIYDFPIEVKGEIPDDMYMMTHDPYVSDEWDKGGSLGVTHVWLTPKYWHTHMITSPLVATYIGKPKGGKKEYYLNLEKLLQFYGNPPRGLWYEANRGEFCRGYFHKVKKPNLLSLRPQYEKGDGIRKKTVNQYGFMVGNLHSKIAMLDDLSDLLLQEVNVQGVKRRVIETLPCIFTIRQIKYYEIDGNYDAVSSLMGYPLYIREEEHRKMSEVRIRGRRKNPIAFFSVNSKIFNRYDNQ